MISAMAASHTDLEYAFKADYIELPFSYRHNIVEMVVWDVIVIL